jgi:phosphatidylglycerophosphate synthase
MAPTSGGGGAGAGGTIPVVWYVPNLLGYARILLALVGLYLSSTNPVTTSIVWLLSASLDLVDGIVARSLNQCSTFGVLVDIIADNILRTAFWLAAATASSKSSSSSSSSSSWGAGWVQVVAVLIISLEWTTMVCTQLHTSQEDGGQHWKVTRDHDPFWIRAIFANNFKSVWGTVCIGGLFGSGYMAYASNEDVLVQSIPYFYPLLYVSFFGRGVTMLAELWLCSGYLSLVIERDTIKASSTCRSRLKS